MVWVPCPCGSHLELAISLWFHKPQNKIGGKFGFFVKIQEDFFVMIVLCSWRVSTTWWPRSFLYKLFSDGKLKRKFILIKPPNVRVDFYRTLLVLSEWELQKSFRNPQQVLLQQPHWQEDRVQSWGKQEPAKTRNETVFYSISWYKPISKPYLVLTEKNKTLSVISAYKPSGEFLCVSKHNTLRLWVTHICLYQN